MSRFIRFYHQQIRHLVGKKWNTDSRIMENPGLRVHRAIVQLLKSVGTLDAATMESSPGAANPLKSKRIDTPHTRH
jgi:hypothetical protein